MEYILGKEKDLGIFDICCTFLGGLDILTLLPFLALLNLLEILPTLLPWKFREALFRPQYSGIFGSDVPQ